MFGRGIKNLGRITILTEFTRPTKDIDKGDQCDISCFAWFNRTLIFSLNKSLCFLVTITPRYENLSNSTLKFRLEKSRSRALSLIGNNTLLLKFNLYLGVLFNRLVCNCLQRAGDQQWAKWPALPPISSEVET